MNVEISLTVQGALDEGGSCRARCSAIGGHKVRVEGGWVRGIECVIVASRLNAGRETEKCRDASGDASGKRAAAVDMRDGRASQEAAEHDLNTHCVGSLVKGDQTRANARASCSRSVQIEAKNEGPEARSRK